MSKAQILVVTLACLATVALLWPWISGAEDARVSDDTEPTAVQPDLLATDAPELLGRLQDSQKQAPVVEVEAEGQKPGLPMQCWIVDGVTGHSLEEASYIPGKAPGLKPSRGSAIVDSCLQPGLQEGAVGIDILEVSLGSYIAWEPSQWHVPVSRYAKKLEVVYPVRPEARVHVRAADGAGNWVRGARPRAWQLAGMRREYARVEADRMGWRLRGVPFYREELLEVLVTLEHVRAPESGESVLEEVEEGQNEPVSTYELEGAAVGKGRLPLKVWEQLHIVVTFGEHKPSEAWASDEVITDQDLPFEESFGAGEKVGPVPQGAIEVTAYTADGRPARGALLWLNQGLEMQRTDQHGRARFTELEAGRYHVTLREPGLLRKLARVDVKKDKTSRIVIREPRGMTVRVRVVDVHGDPLPFATLHLNRWVDIQHGVQRLDPFTDEHGRRTLRGYPRHNKLHASWAGRRGYAKLATEEGSEQDVTIVLR